MDDELKSLFQPLQIGPMTLENRLVFPAVGMVHTWDVAEFLSVRAKGGAGLVMVPNGMLMRDFSDEYFDLHSDEAIPELAKIVREVHAAGAKVGIQIQHQGRQSHFPGTPIAPSPIPWSANSAVPRALTKDEVIGFVEEFSDAVRRARDAGFDMAEIHGAHGYLVGEFLSALSNHRTDEYGGGIGNRARFLIEIIRRSREKAGPDFPISCRLNASDYIAGGSSLEDALFFARLVEKAGASLLNISGGVYGYPVTIPPMYCPPALNVEYAGRIRAGVKIPVCVAGRIDDARLAARILDDGKADLIALGRPLLTDPEWPRKVKQGALHRIRPCLYCNNGCMAHLEGRSPMSHCTVNARLGKDEMQEMPAATAVKKVVVIGGGLAGLETARVAAQRGHRVILCEREGRLGGQWLLAAVPPSKDTFLRYLRWLIGEVELAGVEIRLNTAFSMDDLRAEAPDAVILATGAVPAIPPVPGIDNAVTALDVLRGKVQVGADVLVVGGNATGLEVAHLLAVQGRKVTVIEMTARFGADMPPTVRWHLRKSLDEHGVLLKASVKLKQVGLGLEVTVETKNGEEQWPGFSAVVLATGMRACSELKAALEAAVPEVYVIGDANRPRSGLEAIGEGAQAGARL